MAFSAEQAGGKASDGKERILDIIPETLHQRRSFFVGNDHMVEDVERFIREFPDAYSCASPRGEAFLSLRNVDSCHWRTLTILPQHR